MTNEEFQKLVLGELANIKGQVSETNGIVSALMHRVEEISAQLHNVSHNMDQLSGRVVNIEETASRIAAIQVTQGESINIIALRQLQTESELAALKKAKIVLSLP
jgi:DNA repair ATPase RecN